MEIKRGFRGWWIALAAVLADRVTKVLASRPGAGGALLPGLVNLRPVVNRGAAFSMLSGRTLPLILLTAALVAGLTAWLAAHPDAPRLSRIGLWLIVGGGLGNLIDRVANGAVIDFIDLAFVRFAVFNVADICVCLGAALVLAGETAREMGSRRTRE